MAAMRLIAVGDNCLDVYLSKNSMAVGGNALNVAAQWHRQGCDARYFGVVGKDAEGDVIATAIEAVGLPGADLERRDGATAVTLLLEQDGDRRFLLEDLGVGRNFVPSPERYAALRRADWVHLGTNSSAELIERLIEDRIRFSIDVSTAHQSLDLKGVPLVFASGPDEPHVPVEPVIGALRDRGAARIVLTCGPRGAFFDDGAELVHVPAQAVDVVDTCGAGDSFIATFVVAHLLKGMDAEAAMRLATDAAAGTCLHEGGFPQRLAAIPPWLLRKYADEISAAEG
ncbi:carbohydrate/purine kinase protein (plasmid) [Rhizobium sp. NXC14]|uniref:PfkB family carbohydrate kinase n=1 Tax=Rhizobium sp. NXC14 TaxID=1981173 RepID=UPI000A20BBB0|nr:PfkB family carbohydrate kinase [Rhizobium sp. NXC14]ARO33274.1 carbohydrate/purine kinase protein [Rhizobium sp. NXC14]